MTIETFIKQLPATRVFRPCIGPDRVIRIFLGHWGMNPITAVVLAARLHVGYTTEEVSEPAVAARLLELSCEDRSKIIRAAQDDDHPLRPLLLRALGLIN
jgi:hypothetical protein